MGERKLIRKLMEMIGKIRNKEIWEIKDKRKRSGLKDEDW